MTAKFEKHSLKTVRGVDYTYSTPYSAKKLPKMSSKGRNSLKMNFRAIKNPHTHFHYVFNKYVRFQKDPLRTVGGVYYTHSIPYYAKKLPKMNKFERP